ncbi:MAG: hypothetical protein HQ583_08560 [Candidatus Abyssubacteria bacterium]|nr:hypothetical protein [Candidatus Abyssubacteria bacterium]
MSDKPKQAPPGVDFDAQEIRFDYIKGNFFRVIHVDGVFGGNSPQGNIRMCVWNERWPIPQQMVYELKEGGVLGKEKNRITRGAVVREVEADLVMDVETAKRIKAWLEDKIEKASQDEEEKSKGGDDE